MSTVDYNAIYATLRTAMLTANGNALGAQLGGTGHTARIYQRVPPANPGTSYVVIRLVNNRTSNNQVRTTADLEVMVFSRPSSSLALNRTLSDLVETAMAEFTSGSGATGLLRVTGRQRDEVPAGTGDADAEVVQTRLVFSLILWNHYLHTATSP